MARMKFLCDAERCIECNACVTACKNEHEVPWGVNRRRVVTINDGDPGERSISVACMHCSDAPCMAVCPVDVFYQTEEGVVLHSKDLCIGCGYCFYACPFGAPQYPQAGNYALWLGLKFSLGIRVSAEHEDLGLDMAELGMEAYPEFGHGSQRI